MKILEIILWIIILSKSQLVVDIIYSSLTKAEFASNLTLFLQNSFQDQVIFNLIYFYSNRDTQKNLNNPQIIFDISYSLSLSESIKSFAEENHAIVAKIDQQLDFYSDWEFFTHISWRNRIEALYGIISYLNWNTFIVISDEIYNENCLFFNYFYDKDFRCYSFSNSNNQISANLFIGRVIQPTGIRNIVILSQGESANLLLKALEEHDLLTNKTGIIVGSEGSWNLYGNGVIAYTESGLESADCYYCYEGLAFIKFLNLILSSPSYSDPSSLLDFLNKNTVDHHPISNFTLINLENSKKRISGKVLNGNLTILDPLIYPGNSSEIPNSPTTNVNIWIADGTMNPGAPPEPLATIVTYGEFYALSVWKSMHILDGFEITVTDTDCGVTTYNPNYAYSCFSKLLSTPGVGYLTSLYPGVTIGYIYTLRSLNCSMPNISPYAPSNITESYEAFPEFMTVVKDVKFNTQVILNLAVVFGWKNFVAVYDSNNQAMYDYFVEKIKEFNMNIINPPELRKIDTFYTRKDYSKWESWFKKLLDIKGRLMVIFLTPPYWFHIVESMYDAGLRAGDKIFLSNARMAYSLVWEKDLIQRQKLVGLLYGGIIAAQAEWIGDYGEKIRNGFIERYSNETDFRCLAFDAAMLLLHGIEFTINEGQNVKDTEVLNSNLRKQKFTGCSGTVSIDSGNNQRSLPTIGIFNLRWDDYSKNIYEQFAGLYDSSSTQLITFYKSIVWYDNTTNVPSDIVTYENGCPFPDKMIFRSEKGSWALYGIAAGLIAIAIFESFCIWRKFWKNIRINKLTASEYAHFEDYVLMGVLPIDFLQFISQGPDISTLYPWLSLSCAYSMINFESSVSGDAYWIYIYIAMAISCYWVFAAFILFYELSNVFSIVLEHVKSLSLLLLPIISHIAFVPIISILFSIFQCDRGIGDSITDSFISQDCTTNCWNHKYLLWGILSIISLIAYIPLAIYLRYYYEIINNHINIRTNPIFIIEKAICQVIIIIMNKTLKSYSESLHGLCCSILFFIMILLCLKQSSYSYDRMNLWLITSYFAILWNFIISSIYWLVNFESAALWLTLEYLGFAFLIAAAVVTQCKRCPSLLYTDKVIDISTFFKFEIGSQISAIDLNQMKKEISEFNYSKRSKTSHIGSQSNDSLRRIFYKERN